VANPYAARFTLTVSTAVTLIEITNGATEVVEILRAWVTQENVTATGQAGIALVRKSGTLTGTTLTPVALSSGTPTVTAKHTVTAEGTNGDFLIREGFNIVNGWLYLPIPEERITVPPSGRLGLTFMTAPASASYSYGLVWQELG
jgi:hypothetical protein